MAAREAYLEETGYMEKILLRGGGNERETEGTFVFGVKHM